MKRVGEVLLLIAAAMVILSVFSGFQGVQARAAQPQVQATPNVEDSMNRTVSVSGSGRVSVTPDEATITIGVETRAETAAEALEQNNEQMQALITTLTGEDIAREDIRTQDLQLYPQYREVTDPTSVPQVVGYNATNTLLVTVRDLAQLGTMLDAAVQAGSNRIYGIQFSVSDQVAATDQARSQALADARHKAEQLATLVNGTLGEVISVTESSQVPVPFYGGGGGVQMDRAAAEVPIEPGSQLVEVTLQVVYALNSGTGGGGTNATPGSSQQTLGSDAAVVISPGSGPAGTRVNVEVSNFPPNQTVSIGLGRMQSDSQVVDTVETDSQGEISLTVTIPTTARQNERWVVTVSLADNPAARVSSNLFTVTG